MHIYKYTDTHLYLHWTAAQNSDQVICVWIPHTWYPVSDIKYLAPNTYDTWIDTKSVVLHICTQFRMTGGGIDSNIEYQVIVQFACTSTYECHDMQTSSAVWSLCPSIAYIYRREVSDLGLGHGFREMVAKLRTWGYQVGSESACRDWLRRCSFTTLNTYRWIGCIFIIYSTHSTFISIELRTHILIHSSTYNMYSTRGLTHHT